jgi:transcriptional regulator with XRE-family HTH domain
MTILKHERLTRGLSLRQLAVIIGVSFQYMSLLENGRRKPSFDVSVNLKAYFGIPTEDLISLTESLAKN